MQERSSSAFWRQIAPLRGLAICLVVANHASQAAIAAFVTHHTRLTPFEQPGAFLSINLIRAFTPVCLVLFMFASGFMAFRFMRVRAHAWPAALQMLRRYLGWSCVVLALSAVRHTDLDVSQLLSALLLGQAMPAYWFLLVLIPMYTCAPLLVKLCETRPRLALGLCIALQLCSCAKFYLYDLAHDGKLLLWDLLLIRPLRFVPAFLAGMLVSRASNQVSAWLVRNRRALLPAAALGAALCLAEALLLDDAANYQWERMDVVLSTERLGLIVSAVVVIALALSAPLERPRLRAWLSHAGTHSLGIMLLMDFFIAGTTKLWWKLAPVLASDPPMALAQHALPRSFADASLWLMPVLGVVGLLGPLRAMALARRCLGPAVRHLW